MLDGAHWELIRNIALAIGAVGTVIWSGWGWLKPRVAAYVERARKRSAKHKISLLQAGLDEILRELKPNGGASLRDAVDASRRLSADNAAAIRAYADSSHDGHVDVQADGQWEWVNDTFCRWLHVSGARLLGWGWVNIVQEDSRATLRAEWAAAINERRELQRQVRMVSTDDEIMQAEWSLRPLTLNDDGSVRKWRLHIRKREPTSRHPAAKTLPAR